MIVMDGIARAHWSCVCCWWLPEGVVQTMVGIAM